MGHFLSSPNCGPKRAVMNEQLVDVFVDVTLVRK